MPPETAHLGRAPDANPFAAFAHADDCLELLSRGIIAMSNSIENSDQLAEANQKIVSEGQVLPSVRLKDGSKVQTGTVATMLHNINLYNSGERGQVEKELELAVPTLIKVGLFELFAPDDWINGSNPGRRFVGELAKGYLSEARG
ncbi:conserved hypothetical protein [Halomonas sp. 59]|nr:conserved hypothetical protein [Halomonas sp. 156]CAD5254842.1 hypothetical protein HALOI3_100215 [Halomonas sp. I3]CAD5295250.1 conserved hypothetical protein [Halomonas sp. 113]CAD5296362.1 conserved hypothetical protein [Halomonas sp. 59]VXB87818.1 conserved hypothetical protein [Halomonas titanicae]